MDESVTVYPAPPGEVLSDDWSVSVNGVAVPVYRVRVSAVPLNQRWPGYQRPLDQTELAGAAWWDMSGPVDVEVVSRRAVEGVVVRPRSRGIAPEVTGDRIAFTMAEPGPVTVEVNGAHHALHLFGNPPEDTRPNSDDPSVLYFPPGVHDAGRIDLTSGQTVYIAGGAVVYGAIEARNASGVRILGRGVLDTSRCRRTHKSYQTAGPTEEPFGCIALSDCDDVTISGVVLRDPSVYTITPTACRGVRISDVRIVGSWRYNTDGIHFYNSEDCTVERCFVRSFDDSIVVNGLPVHRGCACGHLPMRNVTVRDCVIWNDWGRALRVGVANSAPEVTDITFRNCDVIHAADVVIGMEHGGRAAVSDIRFEAIRVELDDDAPKPVYQSRRDEVFVPNTDFRHRLCTIIVEESIYSRDPERGSISDVAFRDIRVSGGETPRSVIAGYDADHRVENVTFEDLVINGAPVTDAAAGAFTIGDHVRNVRFTASAP